MAHDEPAKTGNSWVDALAAEVARFWTVNDVAPALRVEFLAGELEKAIRCADGDRVWMLVDVALDAPAPERLHLMHRLLSIRGHGRHQEIVRALQVLRDPSSVPHLVRAFDDNLEGMAEANCSENGVVAKWFSHAFADIGTPEALAAIRHLLDHPDRQVSDEMTYRLEKLAR